VGTGEVAPRREFVVDEAEHQGVGDEGARFHDRGGFYACGWVCVSKTQTERERVVLPDLETHLTASEP
jgi:hypothetical protein